MPLFRVAVEAEGLVDGGEHQEIEASSAEDAALAEINSSDADTDQATSYVRGPDGRVEKVKMIFIPGHYEVSK